MYFTGLIIGVATFLIIGIFHPLVIKGEYWFGVKIWWIFALSGAVTLAASLLTENVMISTLLAVWGASSFWSIYLYGIANLKQREYEKIFEMGLCRDVRIGRGDMCGE